jgi:STE24 endopeptidase
VRTLGARWFGDLDTRPAGSYAVSVSLILLLLVVILWMATQSGVPLNRPEHLVAGLAAFGGFYLALVLFFRVWSLRLARRVHELDVHLGFRRFHKMMMAARTMVPVVFGLGVFWLGWGWLVNERLVAPTPAWPVRLPNVVVGITPALLAWIGLWWSQYPADLALREQSMLVQLDSGLPLHPPPRLWRYLLTNLRLQILFAILPILLVIFMRDLIVVGLHLLGAGEITDTIDSVASLIALATVYAFAPVLLTRVLETTPLPHGPLRDRLQRLCDETGLRTRNILLWHTNGLMGNAAVMGLFPRVRYVLMTDLLLETMTDRQIEAVFAHEIGHVKHRHMLWYVTFIAGYAMLSMGPGEWVDGWLTKRFGDSQWLELAQVMASLGLFWVGFGFVSRQFERQADVFAARTLQRTGRDDGESGDVADLVGASAAPQAPVGDVVRPEGATLFASALRRVAMMTNISVERWEWIHGSIGSRMRFVQELATAPERTRTFDRQMWLLLLALNGTVVAAGSLLWVMSRG